MGYDNEHTEILDIFEDVSYVEPPKQEPLVEKQQETNKKNKKISITITLLPIFSLVYIISTHSQELFNKRISAFSLIMMIILTIFFIIGVIQEKKIKRKRTFQIIRFSTVIAYIAIFVAATFMLYGKDSKIKYFLVEKAMSTNDYHYLATWFYDKDTINVVLNKIKDSTIIDIGASNKLNFEEIKEETTIYANVFEEELLTNRNNTYKKIIVKGKDYQGYFLVAYNSDILKFNTIDKNQTVEILPEPKEEIKNILSINNKELIIIENAINNEYIEYKTITNKSDKYQNEIVIGQRKDNIIMLLVIEDNKALTYTDIAMLFKNYGIENTIIINDNYQLQMDKNNIVITNEEK